MINKETLITSMAYVLHDNIEDLTWTEARRGARAMLEVVAKKLPEIHLYDAVTSDYYKELKGMAK